MAHFYKYVTPSTGRAILENGTLRWSSPPTLNDPFDMQFAFQLRVDRQLVRTLAVEKQWEHLYGNLQDRPLNQVGHAIRASRGSRPKQNRSEFNAEFEDLFDQSFAVASSAIDRLNGQIRDFFSNDKIFCISEAPDNILMWSYYAQNHSGMVLRFNSAVSNSPLSEARPVQYVDQVPSIIDEEFFSDFLAGYGDFDRNKILDAVVYTKFKPWSHEREWRVYNGAGRTSAPYEDAEFNALELDGVIFGSRSEPAHRDVIIQLVKTRYPHAELLQAHPMSDAFQLKLNSLT